MTGRTKRMIGATANLSQKPTQQASSNHGLNQNTLMQACTGKRVLTASVVNFQRDFHPIKVFNTTGRFY